MTNPAVYIVLTTYKRQECALRTVRALKENLRYDNIGWYVVDDGSGPGYIEPILDEIGSANGKFFYDSARRGVGHGMNTALRHIWGMGYDQILMMEDDWVLERPLDLTPYVYTLLNNAAYGMIRFGYLSPNLLGYSVSHEGVLYWRLDNNGETYRFTGHPSLRHRRFHDKYIGGAGMYDEGLSPGMTELSMCGKVNKFNPPTVLYPCHAGAMGLFAHIGSEQLGDIQPEAQA